jgi:hypothetical protein
MRQVGFELTISAEERPRTYALDRAATWTDFHIIYNSLFTQIHPATDGIQSEKNNNMSKYRKYTLISQVATFD